MNPNPQLHEETHLKVLRLLQTKPTVSQRDLAIDLGVSLGKTNFCLQALLERGFVKIQNFRNNQNKRYYAYLLTPAGITAKADLTKRFLQRKTKEYELLSAEIALLQKESQDFDGIHGSDSGIPASD